MDILSEHLKLDSKEGVNTQRVKSSIIGDQSLRRFILFSLPFSIIYMSCELIYCSYTLKGLYYLIRNNGLEDFYLSQRILTFGLCILQYFSFKKAGHKLIKYIIHVRENNRKSSAEEETLLKKVELFIALLFFLLFIISPCYYVEKVNDISTVLFILMFSMPVGVRLLKFIKVFLYDLFGITFPVRPTKKAFIFTCMAAVSATLTFLMCTNLAYALHEIISRPGAHHTEL